MQVDPEVLRALARQVDGVTATIDGSSVGARATSAGDGLPGSTTQWAAHAVGAHVTQLATQLAGNVTRLGHAVRGAGDAYEVADDALAGSFDGLF